MRSLDEVLRRHQVKLEAPVHAHLSALLFQTDGIGSLPPDDHQNLSAAADNLGRFLRGIRNQHGGEWREISIALTPARLADLKEVASDELAADLRQIAERIAAGPNPTIPSSELVRAIRVVIKAGSRTLVFTARRRLREESLYPLWMHQSLALSHPLRSEPEHLSSESFLATWAVRKIADTEGRRSKKGTKPRRHRAARRRVRLRPDP